MADNWGNRWSNRSACVPFPTPGAPTSIMRAAFDSFFMLVFMIPSMAERKGDVCVMFYDLFRMSGPLALSTSGRLTMGRCETDTPTPGRQRL